MPRRFDSLDDDDRGGEVQRPTTSRQNDRGRRHEPRRDSPRRSRERREKSRSSTSQDSAHGNLDRETHRGSRRHRDGRHSSRRSSSSEDDRVVHRKSYRRPSEHSKKGRRHSDSSPDNRHRRKKQQRRRHSSSSSLSSETDERDHRHTAHQRVSGKSRKRSRRSSSSERNARETKRHSRRRNSSSSSSSVSSPDDHHDDPHKKKRGEGDRSPRRSSSSRGRQPESPTQSDSDVEMLSDHSETEENSEVWPPFVTLFKSMFKEYPCLKLIDPHEYRKVAVIIKKWVEDISDENYAMEKISKLRGYEEIQKLEEIECWEYEKKLKNAFTQFRNADLDLIWKDDHALLHNMSIVDLQNLLPRLEDMVAAMQQEYKNKEVFEALQNAIKRDCSFSPCLVFFQNTDRRGKESDKEYCRRLQRRIKRATETHKKQMAELAGTFPFVKCSDEREFRKWGDEFFEAVTSSAPNSEHISCKLEEVFREATIQEVLTAGGFTQFVNREIRGSAERKYQSYEMMREKFNLPENYGPNHYLKVLDALATVEEMKLEIKNLESVKREVEMKMELAQQDGMFLVKHTIPKECRKYLLLSRREWTKETECVVFLVEERNDYLVLDVLLNDSDKLKECHKIMDTMFLKQMANEKTFTRNKVLVITHNMTEEEDSYWRRLSSPAIDQWKIDNNLTCQHQILAKDPSGNPPAPWILRGTLVEIREMKKCLNHISLRNVDARRESRVTQTTTIVDFPYHFGRELEKIYPEDLRMIETATQTRITLLGPDRDDPNKFGVEFNGRDTNIESAIKLVEGLGDEAECVKYFEIHAWFLSDTKEKLKIWKRKYQDVSIVLDDSEIDRYRAFILIVSGPEKTIGKLSIEARDIGRLSTDVSISENQSRSFEDNIKKRQEAKEKRMERYAEEKKAKERDESRTWEEERRTVNRQ